MNEPDEALNQPSLDDRLKQLALEAQQHPKQSKERRQALAKLLRAIQRSGKLSHPRRDQFPGLYEEIYAEAVQRLFVYICERINEYNPQRGEVLQWVNFLLNQRFFIEASRDYMPTGFKGINPKNIQRMTLDDLDRSHPSELNPQLTPSLSQEVKRCLEDDPEGLFQQAFVAGCPDANFQYLSLQRLAGYSWQELSQELKVSIPTLSSFYQRCLGKFAPKFQQYLLL
jgi:hypothetical protein